MSNPPPPTNCPCCGHLGPDGPCPVCGGDGTTLGRGGPLRPGRGNALLDVLRGLDDVRRATFALIFERDYVGRLRWPVAMNAVACIAIGLTGWHWLAPAYTVWFETRHASSAHDGPHLWLFATWLAVGPLLLELLAGFAQAPLRRATERHMLGGTPASDPPRPRLADRAQELLLAGVAVPMALGLVLVPWVGLPLVLLLGAALAAFAWFQAPLAARGLDARGRLAALTTNRWRALGVGLGLELAVVVPFLNVLGLAPVAAIATTSAYLHFDKTRSAR